MSGVMAVILWLKQFSVVLMSVVFALIVATLYWPGRKSRFEHDARIPFEDDR